jgi:uncharacterized protein YqjF (DUF2071 family)
MEKIRFLKAQWKNLLMLNYEVDPEILKPYLPAGTVLDVWEGKTLVSMVGFLFLNTSVLGIKWPFHVNFEEINLRFYVRYYDGRNWKRGAVFVSEIVSKVLITVIANTLYKENYSAMPTRHTIAPQANDQTRFLYEWKKNGNWNKIGATVSNHFQDIEKGSQEEFIFEHYWGYNSISKTKTTEYGVEHVSWQVAKVNDYIFEADVEALYGKAFVPYLTVKPYSAFFANGSDVSVRMGDRIRIAPAPAV